MVKPVALPINYMEKPHEIQRQQEYFWRYRKNEPMG